MRVDIVTIFPEVVRAMADYSILKRAQQQGSLTLNAVDLRDFTTDKHRQVDDAPYGGGAGMVLKPEPLFAAVEHLSRDSEPDVVIVTSPGGRRFEQSMAKGFTEYRHIIIICGHYEGIDQRVLDHLPTLELSIGDYVLTGGELPALVITDSVVRLLPNVLGNQQSIQEESFQQGMLEYPQYTRPANFRGWEVPSVLLSGNHQHIDSWRHSKGLEKTRRNRPDLLAQNKLKE